MARETPLFLDVTRRPTMPIIFIAPAVVAATAAVAVFAPAAAAGSSELTVHGESPRTPDITVYV